MLIRLRGCAGWSAPLLFAYGINRFSHNVAQLTSKETSRSGRWERSSLLSVLVEIFSVSLRHRLSASENTIFEPSHEIMAFFVLLKLILQTCVCSHPVGLDVWFLAGPFVYLHTSCVRTAKGLVRLHRAASFMHDYSFTTVMVLSFRTDRSGHRHVWANSVDPHQTAPTGPVWSGSTLFAIPSESFGPIMILSFRTDRSGQTVRTQIRLQVEQGLHCL